jgi:4-carboxymuconolactone decarboxylase
VGSTVHWHDDSTRLVTAAERPAPLSGGGEASHTVFLDLLNLKELTMSTQYSETPILDLIGSMTKASLDASGLDPESLMLVRFAALIAVDAPPSSYLLNLSVGDEVGLDAERARDVLAAVAPIVGTAKTAAAVGNIMRSLGLALDLLEADMDAH